MKRFYAVSVIKLRFPHLHLKDFARFLSASVKRVVFPYDENSVRYLLQEYYVKQKRKLRANHPRDLVEQIKDIAAYMEIDPTLSKDLIDRASEAYFVKL